MKLQQIKKSLGILLIAGLGGFAAVGILKITDKQELKTFDEKQNISFANYPVLEDGQMLDFTKASELVTPGVVHIISTVERAQAQPHGFDPFDFFGEGFEMPQPGPQQGSGSGVIISADGYIATNNHVIDGASTVEVVLNDKRTYRAEVIGTDPQTDLALVKISEKDLPFIRFGNSDVVKVGEWVLAVGNPFNLTSTVTAGIVSAKGRNINLLRTTDNRFAIENFIQTDAAVNPGNSGGALVNLRGELIGINTAIASRTGSYSGYSFAVPVSLVKKVMDDLLQYGMVQRGFLGIEIRDVDAKLADEEGFKKIEGVYVNNVNEDGAADLAGVKKGDVILKINDVEVNSSSALQEQVSRFHPGDKIEMTVKRKGDIKTFSAVLKNKEGNTEILKKEAAPAKLSIRGAEVENLTRDEKLSMEIRNGVRLSKIQKGAFKDAGVPEGFVVTKIDKRPVHTAQEFQKIMESKKGAILIEGVDKSGKEDVFGIKLD